MPIEIKELHIKVNVDENRSQVNEFYGESDASDNTEAIISACVEKVLEVLNREKLR